jgi:hypothetical protein
MAGTGSYRQAAQAQKLLKTGGVQAVELQDALCNRSGPVLAQHRARQMVVLLQNFRSLSCWSASPRGVRGASSIRLPFFSTSVTCAQRLSVLRRAISGASISRIARLKRRISSISHATERSKTARPSASITQTAAVRSDTSKPTK